MAVIGVGIDLVEIERVALLLQRKGDYALRRLLTEAEREWTAQRRHPAQHVAARIAAKEATYKALQTLPGARAIGWREVEVMAGGDEPPGLLLHGTAQTVAESGGVRRMHLSLTHTATTAAAAVVVEGG